MAKEATAAGSQMRGKIVAMRVVDNPQGYIDLEVRSASVYIDEPSEGAPTVTHRVVLTTAEAAAYPLGAAVTVTLTADPSA